MNRNHRLLVMVVHCCLCGILPFIGCTSQVAGTEVGNPPTVSGSVRDREDNAVSNAAVFLVTPDYNPVLDTIPSFESIGTDTGLGGVMMNPEKVQRMATRTNDEGEFVLDSVMPQAYNLFITDVEGRRVNFREGITVSGTSRNDLGVCELNDIGYATILISDSAFKSTGYISLPGTPVKKSIDSAGKYTVPVISGYMTVNYYNESGDSLSSIISNESVADVVPGDTIDLTGIETILIPPVMALIIGNDTLYTPVDSIDVYDTIVLVAAIGATINTGSKIEYQFYETAGKAPGRWTTDNVYRLPVTSGSDYSVACRIRSASDTTIVTGWTPGFPVRINHYIDSTDTVALAAPYPPMVVDTLGYSDTIFYNFLVTDPIDNPDITLHHRIQWSDTVSRDTVFSLWSPDSVISIHFPSTGMYELRAQARSVEDTLLLSLWSDSIFFEARQ